LFIARRRARQRARFGALRTYSEQGARPVIHAPLQHIAAKASQTPYAQLLPV
jgi:hypothetical protein